MTPEVVAVIQARSGSTRLPGKVLRTLMGVSVLEHVIHRVRAAPGIDRVVVATTTLAADDAVAARAEAAGAAVTRGSEADVLSRFAQAFREHGGRIGVRVTSDCPCLDPVLLGQAIREFRSADPAVDYLSNAIERTFPRGYDIEVFRVDALLEANSSAMDDSSREHVTPYLYRHPEHFRIAALTRPDPCGTAEWRLTLDTEEDWRVISALFDSLGHKSLLFGLAEVEEFLTEQPQILGWNRNVIQKSH